MDLLKYIVPGASVTWGYAERLLKDVPPTYFARFPVVGGVHVSINHPAFVFGHLALYPIQLAEMTRVSTDGLEVPPSYRELFSMGAACHDDPEAKIYPPMEEVISKCFSGYNRLLSRLAGLTAEILDTPLENPSRRERFGTVGAFASYILLAHPQTHLGQVSAWRRCMGLPPA